MEKLTQLPKEVLCQEIESKLKAEGVGYGKKDNLWLISPEYFLISRNQFLQMVKISQLIIETKLGLGEEPPFYLRGDFIPLTSGQMALAEFNEVPVGEGEITALRTVYKSHIGYPEGYGWPFSTASAAVGSLLAEHYSEKKIGILIPPARTGYLKDYLLQI